MPRAADDSRRIALTWCVAVALVAMPPRLPAQGARPASTTVNRRRTPPVLAAAEPCDGPVPVCALLTRFVTAFNARDFEAFRQTFADDISFFVDRPYPPERLDGRAAAEGVFASGFAPFGPNGGKPKPPLPPALVPSHLRVQAFGDVAVITFEVVWPTELARRTLVAHRSGREWRIVHIHGSSADVQR